MFVLSVIICSENAQDIDLYLYNGPKLNVNMPIERAHATRCMDNRNVCPVCHRSQIIHSQNVHKLDLDF